MQIRSSEPVDLSQPRTDLESKHDKFRSLHSDLERCEPRIVSLQVGRKLLGDPSGCTLRFVDIKSRVVFLYKEASYTVKELLFQKVVFKR